MVSRSFEWVPQSPENPLVAEAYSKRRSFAADLSEDFRTYAEVSRICWCSRSRRDYDLVRRKLPNRGDIHFIIPFHNYFVRDLADVLGQVVDEAVIVVEDEDFHSRSPCA